MSAQGSPRDVQRVSAGARASGESPSASEADAALARLAEESARFLDATTEDAAAVVQAAGRVHDILQRRLSEAAT